MTSPFIWPYTLDDNEAFDMDQFNDAITALVSYINSMQSQVDDLEEAAAPDLSGYVTTTVYNAHLASTNPHGQTLLDIDSAPSGATVQVQVKTGALTAGAATPTWDTAFAGGILAVIPVNTSAEAVIAVTAQSTTGCTLAGTGTDSYLLVAIGY